MPDPQLLELSLNAFGEIVDALHDCLIIEDCEERIVWANASACRLTGYAMGELLAKRTADLEPPELSILPALSIYRDDHTRELKKDHVIMRKNGEVLDVALTIRRITVEGASYYLSCFRDISDRKATERALKESEARMRLLATTDPLTGAFNRRFLLDRAAEEMAMVKRHGTTLSVMVLDLDRFKRVNDTYGHLAGDEALRCFVNAILPELRKSDVMARMGGEEFAILLPGTDLEGAVMLADRLRLKIESIAVIFEKNRFRIATSAGVAACSADDPDVESALVKADEALYEAKMSGRNKVVAFRD